MNQDDYNDIDLTSNLTITSELVNQCILINLDGAVTFLTQIDLQKTVKEYLDQGLTTILFDMKKTKFIDSTGLGFFIKLNRELRNKNGKIAFIQPIAHVKEILKNSFGKKVENLIYSSLENAQVKRLD